MFKRNILPVFKKYFSEFLLIFISVILAFAFTEWSNSKNEKLSQRTILTEIKNGLQSDVKDLQANVDSHKFSLRGVKVFRNWTLEKSIPQDSIALYYYGLFRNYTPIINKTGYESLKSSGLKTISNDSLRFKIITLYDFHYKIIEKLEDTHPEMQDFTNYFKPTNDIIHSNLSFDEKGNVIGIQPSTNISENDKKALLSYFWRMEINKKFKMMRYNEIIKKLKELQKNIDEEIKKD